MEEKLSNALGIPWFSKDKMKEILFDTIGFQSREGKVTLDIASLQMMYYAAEQVMKQGQPLILENNFENISKEGLEAEILLKSGKRTEKQ